jgi:hypothetical protein
MNRMPIKSATTLAALRRHLGLPRYARRYSVKGVRPSLPLPPLGTIGDPYLLDRLQAPLRRHRD